MKELYYFSAKIDKKSHECLLSLENKVLSHILVRESHVPGGSEHSMKTPFVECEVEDDEDIKEALFKKGRIFSQKPEIKDNCSVKKIENLSGNYHNRVSRPLFKGRQKNVNGLIPYEQYRTSSFVYHKKDLKQSDIVDIYSGINQLTILIDSLNEIFKTIHPSKDNFTVYRSNIRNLLILSCTEIEAQLKGILKMNILKIKSKYSTNDYVKLKKVLRLDEYIIFYAKFPWLVPLSPFKDWSADFPTKSHTWYNNYNSVKHDREREFHQATLESVLNSVSAIAILLITQYGQDLPYWNDQLGNYFSLLKTPTWTIDEHYFPPFTTKNWKRAVAIK